MRRAFALAFGLAIRRDPLHSLLVPFLIRAPWSVALAMLPSADEGPVSSGVLMISSALLLVDFVLLLVVAAMLRVRALGVFRALPEIRLPPAGECYARGVRRVPWLFATEVVRNMAIVFAMPFLVLPAIFLGFRLSFATEAVVLHEKNLAEAFSRSFRLTRGRFERWVEMIVASVLIVLGIAFAGAVLSVLFPRLGTPAWVAITWLAITAITPVIQYAWTFFYLRLVEVEPGPGTEPAAVPATTAGSAAVSVRNEDALRGVRAPAPDRLTASAA